MLSRRLLAFWFTVFVFSFTAGASPFTAVVAYGDSLSDTGNFYAAVGQPGPPYFEGRVSNGPVAVEYLAGAFGAPLVNFAWIGATTGIGNYLDPGGTPASAGQNNLPGMTASYVSSTAAVAPLASSALFVVWGGPNDFLSLAPLGVDPLAIADGAVTNIVAIVAGLQGLGAQLVLVPGMPDLGLSPSYRALGPTAAMEASALTDYFNMRLAASLPPRTLYFDTAGLLRDVVANPAAYGLTNVTDPCFDRAALTICSTPDQYLFWDDFHPTTRAHQILAGEFAAAIPEPSTWMLSLPAWAWLLMRRRR
jgi:phospholipase/lecithinase/hemolysin